MTEPISPPIPTADLLYSDDEPVTDSYKPSLADSMNQLRDSTGMTEAESEKLLLETAHFFHGANINPGYAQNLHGRIVAFLERPPDDPTFGQWQTESRQRLREKFPDADTRMEAVKQYVNAHPAIRKQLEDSGMGSHPDVILALAARANNLRSRRK
jgi:hypothetical protein